MNQGTEKTRPACKRFALSTLVAALTTALSSQAVAQDYDVVVNNGRVMDPETLFDGVANVGITDGRIVETSKKPLQGTQTIDANGLAHLDTDSSYNPTIGYEFVQYQVGSSDAALPDDLLDFSIAFGGNIGDVDSELDDDLGLGDDNSAQKRPNAPEVNNGTDPTLLTTSAGIQYMYNKFANSSLNSGLWEAYVGIPFGSRKQFKLEFTIPYADSSLDNDFGLGDPSLKFTHVLDVNANNGIAYTAELFFDGAERTDLGYGQEVLELSAFYAKFLPGGHIIAPAWVQTVGLDGRGSNGQRINRSTFDFYIVPKLANPKFYVTFDPAVSYDWETDDVFGSLQVTLGMLTGKLGGGDSQIFIKPGIYVGGDRPLDFSVQIGFKILNF